MTLADSLNGRDRKKEKRAGRPPIASYKLGSRTRIRMRILTVQENLVYIN